MGDGAMIIEDKKSVTWGAAPAVVTTGDRIGQGSSRIGIIPKITRMTVKSMKLGTTPCFGNVSE